MRPHRFCCAVIGAGLALLGWQPPESWAWGPEGHRIIALIADQALQTQAPAVHSKIAEILATDKSNEWTKTDIASEATWADALREKSPEGRVASTKWHYVKLDPDNPDLSKACFGRPALPPLRPASHGPSDNCVVDKIAQFTKELREPDTLASERLMALQFLLNLVGDIHDPLYVIDHDDQNGQCVAVLPPGGKAPVRLNTYWDDTLVAEAAGRDPVKAAHQLTAGLAPGELEKWSGGAPEEWAQQSYGVAKSVVYEFPAQPGPLPAPRPHAGEGRVGAPTPKGAPRTAADSCGPIALYRLDTAYRNRAIAAVKEQLSKAGIRLAFLLRENLR